MHPAMRGNIGQSVANIGQGDDAVSRAIGLPNTHLSLQDALQCHGFFVMLVCPQADIADHISASRPRPRVNRNELPIHPHHFIGVRVLPRQLHDNGEKLLHAAFGQMPRNQFCDLRRLVHRSHDARCGLAGKRISIQRHARRRNPGFAPDHIIVISDDWHDRRRHSADCHFPNHAGGLGADNRADLIVQHIAHIHLGLNNLKPWVVHHLHVVDQAAQKRSRRILIWHDQFDKGPPEESVSLWINLKYRERHNVSQFIVQDGVFVRGANELVKLWDAQAFHVQLHIRLS